MVTISSYAGLTFDTLAKDNEWHPRFERKAYVTRKHIWGGNRDDIHFGGLGNETLKVTLVLTDDSHLAALYGAFGATARTLVIFNETYTSTYLLDVSNPRRAEYDERWLVDVEFERMGS